MTRPVERRSVDLPRADHRNRRHGCRPITVITELITKCCRATGRAMARKRTAPADPVAFVYLRVSTARQASEGIGLEAQEAKCRAHAERMGWPVAEVFADEGISGKNGLDARPGLVGLIERAQATPGAIVVVYSVSRLARRQPPRASRCASTTSARRASPTATREERTQPRFARRPATRTRPPTTCTFGPLRQLFGTQLFPAAPDRLLGSAAAPRVTVLRKLPKPSEASAGSPGLSGFLVGATGFEPVTSTV